MTQRIDLRTGKPLPSIEVMETANRISNASIDGDAIISSLKERLEAAEAAWKKARENYDRPRFLIAGLPEQLAQIQAEIDEIDAERPRIIASALARGGDFTADDELLQRRAALALKAERIKLGAPSLQPYMKSAERVQAATASEVTDLREQIESRRKRLKLAAAERHCA